MIIYSNHVGNKRVAGMDSKAITGEDASISETGCSIKQMTNLMIRINYEGEE
jgi:hypothetical protein